MKVSRVQNNIGHH